MKIVVVHGSNSSAEYVEVPKAVDYADVVIGVWPPDYRPIIMRAPEGVEIQMLHHHWMAPDTLFDGIDSHEWQDNHYERGPEQEAHHEARLKARGDRA